MCRKNHSLVATWNDFSGTVVAKTVTTCTVGQPVIFVHQVKSPGYDNSGTGWCKIRFESGVKNTKVSNNSCYYLGSWDINAANNTWNTYSAAAGGVASIVCIPTATTVKITVLDAQDDDIIHVYKT